MAGAASRGELISRAGARFAIATTADEEEIRHLLRENPMPGAIRLTFEREPDYFQGANVAGGVDRTIVAHAGADLICMGRCTRRECWLGGEARRVGYLAELRLDRTARGRFAILRGGYEFFELEEAIAPADFYFTSIAADNQRARGLLEAGVRGLPKYEFLAELDTLIVAVPRRPAAAKLRVEAATRADVPELIRMLNEHGRGHALATVWTVERLADLQRHGLPIERFLMAFVADQLVGCGALWDQRGFRQTVIRGYSRVLAAARPLVNVVGGLFGTPMLPSPGTVLRHAFLSPLAFARGAETILPDFIAAALPFAAQAGVEFLTMALPTMDGRLPAVRRQFSTRTWRSRLYEVQWRGQAAFDRGVDDAEFVPDVALL